MCGDIRSNPVQVNFFFPFMHQPCCYFMLYKELLYQNVVFSKICNHTSLYGPIESGASVNSTSQVCLSAMLVLLIVGN
jgi:hypothetical protein